jgi:uncharacterized protein
MSPYPPFTRVAVMAKAPVAGQAKTRLAPALGAAGAAALAERLLRHAAAQATAAGLGPVTVWATPDGSHPVFRSLQQALAVALALQGKGDIGQRMAQVFAAAFAESPAPLLLMGTDLPRLDAAVLQQAARALQACDAVFVPALDGGYGLVGLRRPAPSLFSGIAWSTPRVMHQTRQRLAEAGLSAVELAPLPDIDEPQDLAHLPPDWQGDTVFHETSLELNP